MRGGRLTQGAIITAIGSVYVLVFASPAGASLDGPCEGQGVFQSDGQTVDARTQDRITVPEEDDVAYVGNIATAEENRSHEGAIQLDLPFPLPDVTIVDWGTDDTDETEDTGTHHYELPAIAPRGVELRVTGYHDDTGGHCSGTLTIEIDGGPMDSPLPTAGAAVGTLLSGALLGFAGKVKRP